MSKLHKGSKNIGATVETKAGKRRPLCSNKTDVRFPALGFNSNNEYVSEDIALDYLASVLVEIFLHTYYASNEQKGSDLLPRFNEGTG